jgi:hypothetical protein
MSKPLRPEPSTASRCPAPRAVRGFRQRDLMIVVVRGDGRSGGLPAAHPSPPSWHEAGRTRISVFIASSATNSPASFLTGRGAPP